MSKKQKIVLKTNMQRESGFVYHITLDNKVYKGKMGAIPNHPREFVCKLDFKRKDGFAYYLNDKCEVVEILFEDLKEKVEKY